MNWLLLAEGTESNAHPWWMDEVAATLISTAFSTLIASGVAWLVAHLSDRAEQRRTLNEQILKIIDLGMEYPYLEDDSICDKWPNTGMSRDDQLRYENYCCLVFNVMESIWTYCKGNRAKFRMILHYEELIWRHRCWWESDAENKKGYPVGYRNLVDAVIKARREKESKGVTTSNNC